MHDNSMMNKTNVPQQETIIKLLEVLFPTAKIILFGSRARGTHTERSDIDIAIDLGRKMTIEEIGLAKNVLAGLFIAQTIDIVCMHRISDAMKEQIMKEGIVWKE